MPIWATDVPQDSMEKTTKVSNKISTKLRYLPMSIKVYATQNTAHTSRPTKSYYRKSPSGRFTSKTDALAGQASACQPHFMRLERQPQLRQLIHEPYSHTIHHIKQLPQFPLRPSLNIYREPDENHGAHHYQNRRRQTSKQARGSIRE